MCPREPALAGWERDGAGAREGGRRGVAAGLGAAAVAELLPAAAESRRAAVGGPRVELRARGKPVL